MPDMSGPSPKHANTPPLGFALNSDGCRKVISWPLHQAFSIRSCPPLPAYAVPVMNAAAAIAATAAANHLSRCISFSLLISLIPGRCSG
jgi:hypothetical protein